MGWAQRYCRTDQESGGQTIESLSAVTANGTKINKQKLPTGWDEKRLREVIAHYENQNEDEQAAEIAAAHKAKNVTFMAVPTELVPEVRALLARKRSA